MNIEEIIVKYSWWDFEILLVGPK